jgi:hypothetical protein
MESVYLNAMGGIKVPINSKSSMSSISYLSNSVNFLKNVIVASNENLNTICLTMIGTLVFLSTLVMFLNDSPSTNACFKSHKIKQVQLGGVLIGFVCVLIFVGNFYNIAILKHNVDPSRLLFLLFVITLISFVCIVLGIIKFIQCSDNSDMNEIIRIDLSNDPKIIKLISQYESLTSKMRPVSACLNFHNGQFRETKNKSCLSGDTTCNKSNKTINKTCNPLLGAKLADFYISGSNQSCRIPGNDNFVSAKSLEMTLLAGARCIDMDIYSDDQSSIPVVKTTWNDREPLNSIPLQDCWDCILDHAFTRSDGDPLLIHLNLKTTNIETLDIIALTFVQTFNGNNVLNADYSYRGNKSVVLKPICTFFNKIILIVTGECKSTRLDQLVNIHTSVNGRLINDSNAEFPTNGTLFSEENKKLLTIVKPIAALQNPNPSLSLSYGSQIFLMNYWNLDEQMRTYCSFFNIGSFVLKDFDLQDTNKINDSTETSIDITS